MEPDGEGEVDGEISGEADGNGLGEFSWFGKGEGEGEVIVCISGEGLGLVVVLSLGLSEGWGGMEICGALEKAGFFKGVMLAIGFKVSFLALFFLTNKAW
jgi:hypothetical protein